MSERGGFKIKRAEALSSEPRPCYYIEKIQQQQEHY